MKSKKTKVVIVGENKQNDSEPLQLLLTKVAATDVDFKVYSKNFEGGQLDGAKFFRTLETEAEFSDWIILVRDLDSLLSDTKKLKEKDDWFQKANKMADKKGIFFLAIYEMEALILADIDSFNAHYGLKTKPVGDPMTKSEPKEMLKKLTLKTQKGEYKESDALAIFKNLNLKNIYKKSQRRTQFSSLH